jgi:hypothetical protein
LSVSSVLVSDTVTTAMFKGLVVVESIGSV